MPFVEADSDRIERVLLGAGYGLQRVPLGSGEGGVPWTLRVTLPGLDHPDPPQTPVDTPSETPVGPPVDGSVGLSLQDASGALLAQIEDLEAERARLDGRIVAAYGALRTVIGEQLAGHERALAAARAAKGLPARGGSPAARAVGVDEAVLAELTTATAVPFFEAARRLRLAAAPRRHAGLTARLAAGTVSLLHATMIAEACHDLEHTGALGRPGDTGVPVEALVEEVTARVLAPLPDGSRPTHPLIRSRLARITRKLRGPGSAGTRRAALARRRLEVMLTEDGMGILTLQVGAEHAVAISDRVEALARAMRQAGDPRTLDQLRADLAAQALLRHRYGPCPTHARIGDTNDETDADDADDDMADGIDDVDVDGDVFGGQGPGCGCAPAAPPATAWIVVPFEVATGASDAACELPGHGWVTAEHARAVITAPGSVWRWLAVDQLTGRALELGTDRYRPTPAMIEQVRAVDGHCRGPGCQTPASRCDLDHHVPYPHGPTSVANLGPLHRRHHNLKTAGLWTCTPLPAADPNTAAETAATLAARDQRGLAWRTLTGRDYLTYPKSWTEALHDPDAPEHTPPTRRANTARQEHRDRQARDEYWNQRHGWNDPPPF